MMGTNSRISRLFGRFRRDSSGVTTTLIGLALTSMMGLSAMVIDVGSVFVARRALQTSADAAALSGAAVINGPVAGAAITTANNYSATSGKYNSSTARSVTMVSGYPQLRCLTSIGVSRSGSDSSNAFVVRQRTSVPTYFARLFGISQMTVTATSTAALAAGVSKPLEIMMVVDTTGSMNSRDASCGTNVTKLRCAQNGARELMSGISPTASRIGLMVFPPTANATEAAKNYDCSTSSPAIRGYKSAQNGIYDVLPLGNDFKANDSSADLTATSNIVIAMKGGCNNGGMSAVGGVGTYYADAITRAQNRLVATGRADVQRVIILLSDGDATADRYNIDNTANQCRRAINAAAAAKTAGTWVYSIAYDAQTSGCSYDSGSYKNPCKAMRDIASDQTKFFSSDGGSGSCPSVSNPTTNLSGAFAAMAQQFRGTRLLPNNVT